MLSFAYVSQAVSVVYLHLQNDSENSDWKVNGKRLCRSFQWKGCLPFTQKSGISGKLFVNGKPPQFPKKKNSGENGIFWNVVKGRFPFTVGLKTCYIWHKFHSFSGCPQRLHFRAILGAKIKDMAANSLELVKLVNETRISIGKVSKGKTGLPLQTFRFSRNFSTGTTRKVVFHLLSNRNFRNLLVDGERPKIPKRNFRRENCVPLAFFSTTDGQIGFRLFL